MDLVAGCFGIFADVSRPVLAATGVGRTFTVPVATLLKHGVESAA